MGDSGEEDRGIVVGRGGTIAVLPAVHVVHCGGRMGDSGEEHRGIVVGRGGRGGRNIEG